MEVQCQTWEAKMRDTDPPAFSDEFKKYVKEMALETEESFGSNILTEKVSEFVCPDYIRIFIYYSFQKINNKTGETIFLSHLKIENQKKFDRLFSKFIEVFGTHYIVEAKMGAQQRNRKEMTKTETEQMKNKDVEVNGPTLLLNHP